MSHFTPREFACQDGTPYPAAWRDRLATLCALLEAIRTLCGDRPVVITSGYRTPVYNRQVGGSRYSQHVEGRAADIQVQGVSAGQVHDRILAAYRRGALPTLGGLGRYRTFTHVDVRPSKRLARWGG